MLILYLPVPGSFCILTDSPQTQWGNKSITDEKTERVWIIYLRLYGEWGMQQDSNQTSQVLTHTFNLCAVVFAVLRETLDSFPVSDVKDDPVYCLSPSLGRMSALGGREFVCHNSPQ